MALNKSVFKNSYDIIISPLCFMILQCFFQYTLENERLETKVMGVDGRSFSLLIGRFLGSIVDFPGCNWGYNPILIGVISPHFITGDGAHLARITTIRI